MAKSVPHISVCICTFRRPHLLGCLLRELDCQETDGSFTYSIMIVDNDVSESSREVVSKFQKASSLQVSYVWNPSKILRWRAIRHWQMPEGDFVAFIDDDELPASDWLLKLFQTCETYEVDGVLGPVLPQFEHESAHVGQQREVL